MAAVGRRALRGNSPKIAPPPRVIVLHGRSLMSLVVAHSLSKRGVEVIGADDVELTVLSFSRYVKRTIVHQPLREDPEPFLSDLEDKIRRLQPPDERPYVLFPVFRETDLIAKHRARFERYAKVAAPPFEAIDQVHPKDHLALTAQRLGLPAPRTFLVSSQTELPPVADALGFPVILKPTNDMGGRGVVSCSGPTELREAFRAFRRTRNEAPLLQQYVAGDDYCMTVLADHGEIRAAMAYRNIQKFPPDSGAGVARETVDDAPFMSTVQTLFREVGWHGIAQVDFLWTPGSGTDPQLIEVNPRFWLGLFHSVESGVDFPWLLYQLTVDGSVGDRPVAEIGRRTKTPGLWLMSAVRDIAGSEENFTRLSAGWHDAEDHISSNGLRETLKRLTRDAETTSRVRDILPRLRAIIRQGRTAKNDLFFRDDPFVALGVLYVLASLIRHKRLPSDSKK